MNADDIHPTFRQALGCHEGFRRLGFEPEDLYFVYQHKTEIFYIQLQTQQKEFYLSLGYIKDSQEEIYRQWTAITQAVRDRKISEAVLQQCWAESMVYQDPTGFLEALVRKGFTIPNVQRLKERGERPSNQVPREN